MTLQQINYVLTVSDAGSMNQAAEKLFISQPTLTSAIRELEKETGITIFARTTRGVSITREGQEFLMYARQIWRQVELLQQKYGEKGTIRRKFLVSAQHYSFAVKAFVETVEKYGMSEYEFGIHEVRTMDVIEDVGQSRSEVGVIYLSEYNRKYMTKLLNANNLEFHLLGRCKAYVYLWRGHPLAHKLSIGFRELQDYPCLSFEQGEKDAFYLAEEILPEDEYTRVIKTSDRATMLNLMVGMKGYTLCSGIICKELNGSDYVAIPFEPDENHSNVVMEIGYLIKKYSILSSIGQSYIKELRRYFEKLGTGSDSPVIEGQKESEDK